MTGVGGLSRLTGAQSRTISPENRTGAKGAAAQDTDGVAAAAARDLGPGWKISPFVYIEPGATLDLASGERLAGQVPDAAVSVVLVPGLP